MASLVDIERDSRSVWIGNISSSTTEICLWNLLCKVGPLESVEIPIDHRTGRKKSFAFVVFERQICVPEAIEMMDGAMLYGRILRVCWKYPQRPRNIAEILHSSVRVLRTNPR